MKMKLALLLATSFALVGCNTNTPAEQSSEPERDTRPVNVRADESFKKAVNNTVEGRTLGLDAKLNLKVGIDDVGALMGMQSDTKTRLEVGLKNLELKAGVKMPKEGDTVKAVDVAAKLGLGLEEFTLKIGSTQQTLLSNFGVDASYVNETAYVDATKVNFTDLKTTIGMLALFNEDLAGALDTIEMVEAMLGDVRQIKANLEDIAEVSGESYEDMKAVSFDYANEVVKTVKDGLAEIDFTEYLDLGASLFGLEVTETNGDYRLAMKTSYNNIANIAQLMAGSGATINVEDVKDVLPGLVETNEIAVTFNENGLKQLSLAIETGIANQAEVVQEEGQEPVKTVTKMGDVKLDFELNFTRDVEIAAPADAANYVDFMTLLPVEEEPTGQSEK